MSVPACSLFIQDLVHICPAFTTFKIAVILLLLSNALRIAHINRFFVNICKIIYWIQFMTLIVKVSVWIVFIRIYTLIMKRCFKDTDKGFWSVQASIQWINFALRLLRYELREMRERLHALHDNDSDIICAFKWLHFTFLLHVLNTKLA